MRRAPYELPTEALRFPARRPAAGGADRDACPRNSPTFRGPRRSFRGPGLALSGVLLGLLVAGPADLAGQAPRFEELESDLKGFKASVSGRFDAVDRRLGRLEESVKTRFDAVDSRLARLDDKLDKLHMDHELRLTALEARNSDS